MLNLTTWAARWGVPLEALQDLKQQIGLLTPTDPAPMAGASPWVTPLVKEATLVSVSPSPSGIGTSPTLGCVAHHSAAFASGESAWCIGLALATRASSSSTGRAPATNSSSVT